MEIKLITRFPFLPKVGYLKLETNKLVESSGAMECDVSTFPILISFPDFFLMKIVSKFKNLLPVLFLDVGTTFPIVLTVSKISRSKRNHVGLKQGIRNLLTLASAGVVQPPMSFSEMAAEPLGGSR